MTTSETAAIPSLKPESNAPKFTRKLARSMLFAMLAFAFVPISIMGIAGFARSQGILEEQVERQLHGVVHNEARDTQENLTTKRIRLDRIVHRSGFVDAAGILLRSNGDSAAYQEAREQLLAEFDANNRPDSKPLFDDFILVDLSGNIYASSQAEWQGASLTEKNPYDLFTQEGQSIGIFDLAPIQPNKFAFYTMQKLHTAENEDLGLLIGITRSASAQIFLEKMIAFDEASVAYYVTEDGNFVGIDSYTRLLEGFAPAEEQRQNVSAALAKVDRESGDPSTTLFEYANLEGVGAVAVAQWLPGANVAMVMELPESVAYGQLETLVPFSILLFVLTFLAMVIIISINTNRFIKPVLAISNATRLFADGDWQVRAPIERTDELGLLAYSFNQMADELSTLYRSLRHQVDERTDYIRTASEVAQSIVGTFDLDELLNKTVTLIVERFHYYHAGIFMIDPTGTNAALRAAYGPAANEMLASGHSLLVGSPSIVGWVAEHNQPRVASDVGEDPIHFRNKLLPETRAEVGVPITSGNLVLGVLDVQSTQAKAFDSETVLVLQTLANQIATALQNVNLLSSTEVNLQELERLYRSSRQIAEAKSDDDVFDSVRQLMQEAPFISAVFQIDDDKLLLRSAHDPHREISLSDLPQQISVSPSVLMDEFIFGKSPIVDLQKTSTFPQSLTRVPRKMGCRIAAFLPVIRKGHLHALVMVGARDKERITSNAILPYSNMTEIMISAFDRIEAEEAVKRRLEEMEAISATSQAMSTSHQLASLYATLHEQVRQIMGDYSFIVALYDALSDTIRVPYVYEDGQVSSLETFPLGEGLTSILIHTGQPLMLVEDTETRAAALGAKIVGRAAKSWMGTPMQVGGEVIGALIVQDSVHEHSFNEDDLRFMNSLANQVSGAIYNARLLEDSRRRAIQLQSAAEIARDISGSLHLDELLNNAVNMICDRFNYYHASVFLLDNAEEYAVIRESTGEAGAQMKRDGHKLSVGSQSIVGYVSSSGKVLIIDDTTKDATHYANPLLPETRSEVAIPLKVGERILGVLDVQSAVPYAFSEEIVQTLSILADQLAVAVINTELFAETQEHLSQHRLLHHITTSAASGSTLDEALDGAVRGLQVTLGGDRVSILMLDAERKTLEVRASIGYSEDDIDKIRIPLGTGITGVVAATQKLLRVDDVHADPRYIKVSANTHAELAIPLTFRNELLGVLNVESEEIAAYDENDEEMLGTLGGSLAAIIANARLLEQVRRQAERERMLREITGKIRRSTNVQTILATTAGEISKVIGARRTQIKMTVEEQTEDVEARE